MNGYIVTLTILQVNGRELTIPVIVVAIGDIPQKILVQGAFEGIEDKGVGVIKYNVTVIDDNTLIRLADVARYKGLI